MPPNGTECCGLVEVVPPNGGDIIGVYGGSSYIECNQEGRVVKWEMGWTVGSNLGCNAFLCDIVSLDPLLQLTELEHIAPSYRDIGIIYKFRFTFPTDLGKWKKLRTMQFHGDFVGGLPPTIKEIESLETMSFTGLSLRDIDNGSSDPRDYRQTLGFPNVISEMKNLKSLSIKSLRITSFPQSFANMRLEKLNLENCVLDGPGWGWLGTMRRLTELSLSGPDLGNAAKELPKLTLLTSLTIEEADLPAIPDEISNLQLLRNLALPKNRIKTIPPFLTKFQYLENLNLHQNLLDLSDNRFTGRLLEFLGIEPARKMETIDVSGNYFYGEASAKTLKPFSKSLGNTTMMLGHNCFRHEYDLSEGLDPKNTIFTSAFGQRTISECIESIFEMRLLNSVSTIAFSGPSSFAASTWTVSSTLAAGATIMPAFTTTKVQDTGAPSRAWTQPGQTVTEILKQIEAPGTFLPSATIRIEEKVVSGESVGDGNVVIAKGTLAGIVAVVALVSVLMSFAVVVLIGRVKGKSGKEEMAIQNDVEDLGNEDGGSVGSSEVLVRGADATSGDLNQLISASVRESSMNVKSERGFDERRDGLFEELRRTTWRIQDIAQTRNEKAKTGDDGEGLFEGLRHTMFGLRNIDVSEEDVAIDGLTDDVKEVDNGSVVSNEEDGLCLPSLPTKSELNGLDPHQEPPLSMTTLSPGERPTPSRSSNSSRSVHQWTPDQVCLWLDSVGFREKVCQAFRGEHFLLCRI
ncbi:hypothetical protein HDU97_008546 [Phlyctochytrium planicorne]|nr:hypothetical protein HDU97_008546 [Phlyctochytrium planicorne]